MGEAGMETPTLRFLGLVGEIELGLWCGDSDPNLIGWDRARADGGSRLDREACGVVGQLALMFSCDSLDNFRFSLILCIFSSGDSSLLMALTLNGVLP